MEQRRVNSFQYHRGRANAEKWVPLAVRGGEVALEMVFETLQRAVDSHTEGIVFDVSPEAYRDAMQPEHLRMPCGKDKIPS